MIGDLDQVVIIMPFVSGFFLLTTEYEEGEEKSKLISKLQELGFEVYDTGGKFLVYYIEADSERTLRQLLKHAESIEGIAKAYIVYSFMGSNEMKEYIERGIEEGYIELDESTKKFLKDLIKSLQGG